jgi:dTDP-4-amino-4,6-dideoxygalactose transaminase
VLAAKLPELDRLTLDRSRIAARYMEGLADTPIKLPYVPHWAEPVWHLFVVRHPNRDCLREELSRLGVGTLIHYPVPPHLQPAYADLGYCAGDFPVAEAIHREVISLPIWPTMPDDAVEYVIESTKQAATLAMK